MKFLFRVLIIFFISVLGIWVVIARPFGVFSSDTAHDIDTSRLKEEVRKISQDYYPRDSEHPEVLLKLSEYIHGRFSQYSPKVEFQEYEVDGARFRNVIANFGPNSERILVIGAHYDAFSNLPGADDNASGVVGLLELGRLLQSADLSIGLQLVAYCLEEPPYFASEQMGSFVHASNLKSAGAQVELMISLEMIGFYSEESNSQSYPVPLLSLMYPSKGDFIAVVDKLDSNAAFRVKESINKYTAVASYSINAPTSLAGVDFSDHRNYWVLGYPAVMITDTAFFRNSAYHTEQDTYDRLNYKKMSEVIYGVFMFVQNVE